LIVDVHALIRVCPSRKQKHPGPVNCAAISKKKKNCAASNTSYRVVFYN
jgi:hypothetical protein